MRATRILFEVFQQRGYQNPNSGIAPGNASAEDELHDANTARPCDQRNGKSTVCTLPKGGNLVLEGNTVLIKTAVKENTNTNRKLFFPALRRLKLE
jgi:hypothetical protein